MSHKSCACASGQRVSVQGTDAEAGRQIYFTFDYYKKIRDYYKKG